MAAFVIGIGGGSGSGKSVVASDLCTRLAPLKVEVLGQDRYFHRGCLLPRHESQDGARSWPDHNHPDSFDFERLRGDLRSACEGSADVVIVEGILALHDAELRRLMDLKLFVEADADERIVRRIRRNVARGYDLEEVCEFYLDSVRYRHLEFCEPTRDFADLIIPGGRDDRALAEAALEEACRRARAASEETVPAEQG